MYKRRYEVAYRAMHHDYRCNYLLMSPCLRLLCYPGSADRCSICVKVSVSEREISLYYSMKATCDDKGYRSLFCSARQDDMDGCMDANVEQALTSARGASHAPLTAEEEAGLDPALGLAPVSSRFLLSSFDLFPHHFEIGRHISVRISHMA